MWPANPARASSKSLRAVTTIQANVTTGHVRGEFHLGYANCQDPNVVREADERLTRALNVSGHIDEQKPPINLVTAELRLLWRSGLSGDLCRQLVRTSAQAGSGAETPSSVLTNARDLQRSLEARLRTLLDPGPAPASTCPDERSSSCRERLRVSFHCSATASHSRSPMQSSPNGNMELTQTSLLHLWL